MPYLMVSVSAKRHNIVYLSYDQEERQRNSEIYMWALELQTRVRKNHELIGFCQFLKIAEKNEWELIQNTGSTTDEVIYLLHYTTEKSE